MRSFSIIISVPLKLKVKQAKRLNKGYFFSIFFSLCRIKGSIQKDTRDNSWIRVLGVAHTPLNELNVLTVVMQKNVLSFREKKNTHI